MKKLLDHMTVVEPGHVIKWDGGNMVVADFIIPGEARDGVVEPLGLVWWHWEGKPERTFTAMPHVLGFKVHNFPA